MVCFSIDNYRAMHSTLQIKETKKTEGIRAITLVSDRLHAGGFHNSEGTLEVLLRRSSLWADVTDYPEPFRNQWTKEQGSTLSRSLDMMSSKGRKLMQAATIRDPHRFFYLMNTNTDKELQNLRMEDEDAPVIDRMNFYVHFDLFTNLEPAQPLLYFIDSIHYIEYVNKLSIHYSLHRPWYQETVRWTLRTLF